MGSQFVTDPFWGSFGSSTLRDLDAAPGRALSNTHAAEVIVDERIKRGREKELHDLGVKLGDEMAATLVPTPVEPTHTVGPMVGDINNPPAGIPEGEFIDPRIEAASAAEDARKRQVAAEDAIRFATLKGDISQFYPMRGQGHALIGGRPTPLDQFETTGRMPTADERATPPVHNLSVTRPDGSVYVVATPDYRTELGTHRPLFGEGGVIGPGDKAVGTGAGAQAAPNPLDKEGDRLKLITDYANKVANGHVLEPAEARLVAAAMAAQYGLQNEIKADARGNIVEFKGFQPHQVPGVFGVLAGKVNQTLEAANPPPAPDPSRSGGAVEPPAPAVPTDSTVKTTVLSSGDANQRVATTAAAVGRADVARRNIETQIGIVNGQMPPNPYVPNLAAAVLAEKNNGIVNGMAIAALDPKAPRYLADAKAWVESVLRLASGAAIRPEEYGDYAQIFIPNRNDTKEAIQAKLDRMAQWAQLTATAANADQATQMLMNVSKGDPAFHDMAI